MHRESKEHPNMYPGHPFSSTHPELDPLLQVTAARIVDEAMSPEKGVLEDPH